VGAWEGVRVLKAIQGSKASKEAEAGAAAAGNSVVQAGMPRLARGSDDVPPDLLPCVREAFPSARQKRCAGLKRSYYPDYVREFVDYDYDESLPEAARVFLAAFSEEYYRGWRLKRETQLHGIEHLRAAGAEQQRRRAHQDPLGFAAHRGTELVERPADRDVELEMVRALDERR
jgi:hypothetical protein